VTIRWSPEAAADLEQIFSFIASDKPKAAEGVVNRIYAGIEALLDFPNRGRTGRAPGSRELPLTPLPYVVVYRVTEDAIEMAGFGMELNRGGSSRPRNDAKIALCPPPRQSV
jgi:addiction module RelE/StbE family toxin